MSILRPEGPCRRGGHRRVAPVSVIPGLMLSLAACLSSEVDPRFEMVEKKVLVMPFEDRDVPVPFSRPAVDLSRGIAKDIAENNLDDIEIVPFREVEEYFRSRDISRMTAQEVGMAFGVHYVIFGELLKFDTRGEMIGLDRGVLEARVKVQDVVENLVAFDEDILVHFPEVPSTGWREQVIERRLLGKSASAIGRWFYAHEPEGEEMEMPQ